MEELETAPRINTFYKAPIGEENFKVKVMAPKPSPSVKIKKHPQEAVKNLIRAPSVDQRAKPFNPRFERKVLFNHERT